MDEALLMLAVLVKVVHEAPSIGGDEFHGCGIVGVKPSGRRRHECG